MSAIAVAFGGLSPEHDISILTGLQAVRLLDRAGADVVPLYWTRTGGWSRVPADLEGADFAAPTVRGSTPVTLRVPDGFSERRRKRETALDIDVVVNCCHGGPGEDGSLAALLALCGLKVTGPGSDACAWTMDKLATAGLVALAGLGRFDIEAIPTIAVTEGLEDLPFPSPWVLKPRFAGSSVGVEVGIEDVGTLRTLSEAGIARSGAVVQPYLEGWSDLNIAVRAYPEIQCSAIERPISGRIYGYSEKYLAGADGMESARRELPAVLDSVVEKRLRQATQTLADVLRLSGTPRVDFLWDGKERLALCEVNAIPGSLALYLWAASGVDRTQLLLDIVAEARRTSMPAHWSAATDGAALRAANSVASKLR